MPNKQTNSEKRYINSSLSNIEIRAKDDKSEISGYAAVFYDGTPESEYELWPGLVERIDKDAFNASIADDDIRALFNHDPNMILGRNKAGTLSLTIDEKGLQYNIIVPDTQVGNDVRISVDRGDVSGSSFSFQATRVEWVDEGEREIRLIKEAKLYDVGPVTFPAYSGASAFARDADVAKSEREELEAEKRAAEQAKQAAADADYADSVAALVK